MPDPGFLKIVDKNGKAVWSADQTQDFCKKSKRVTSNCESVGCTERMCRKKYTEFGATDTKLMRYYYKVNGQPAEEELYVNKNETLLNLDLRN